MNKIIPFDYLFTNFFSGIVPHNIFFDYFFSFFSLKGSSVFIWILIIIIVIILEERKNPGISIRDKKFMFMFSGSFIFTFFVTDMLLKNIFIRPRPMFSDFIRLYPISSNFICPTDFSFPSAHAATAFVAAGILAHYDKKRKWFYYTVAVLISYSRIYLGCHFFFDVVVGAILGYIISRLLLFVPDTFPSHKKS